MTFWPFGLSQTNDCWKKAQSSARLFMEAAVLEANDYVTAAMNKFEKAQQEDQENPLAASLMNAFLWRYDLIE